MPGVIVFKRRWSVGSDDLIVPAGFLVLFHSIWLTVLVVTAINQVPLLDSEDWCQWQFLQLLVAFLIIWLISVVIEGALIVVSLRGTILEDELRWHSEYLLYIKLILWLAEIGFTIFSVMWMKNHYISCSITNGSKNLILGLIVFNGILFLIGLMTIWCSFDVAGRSWVKLKKYQKNLRDQGTKNKKFQYKRSGGNSARSWRHRKVRRAYQNSWDSRCRFLLCCVNPNSRKSKSSFADIANVLSEFFRDLDVVPSDVIVGLVLLRKRQQLLRFRTVHQTSNSVYQFLSGVRVTPQTRFLNPTDSTDHSVMKDIHHFMHFAVAVYGWPMYLRKNTATAICKLCSSLRCMCMPLCNEKPVESVVLEDNCCGCNFAAFTRMCHLPDTYVVYITYHVDVGETPFMVAIDYSQKAIVISIRGTLSLEDIITDLNAEGEPLPIRPINEEWIGHKGMASTAAYIYKKLKEEHLLTKAFTWDQERHTEDFDIVCVGHSLGAGTATILAIMLKQEFPSTRCFAYSPPGGLLSQEAVEYTKSFVTSVVLGKDVVPRIGLHQLEALRHDLIYAIHKSTDPKWKTLLGGMICCFGGHEEWTESEVEAQLSPKSHGSAAQAAAAGGTKDQNKKGNHSPDINIHPWDSTVNLSVHQPLYPPGRIVHVVRHYPKPREAPSDGGSSILRSCTRVDSDPVFKAIWAEGKSFDEVLISKRMVQDHMPDNVLDALEKLVNQTPEKPCEDLHSKAADSIVNEPELLAADSKPSGQQMKIHSEGTQIEAEVNYELEKLEELKREKSPLLTSRRVISEAESRLPLEAATEAESQTGVVAPMASPEDVLESTSPPSQSHAQLDPHSYPAFHSVQTEYSSLTSSVHIEPFYRYRVHSDA